MSAVLPKQFIELQGEAIIIKTIRKIVSSKLFDAIVVIIHRDWKEYLIKLLTRVNFSIEHIFFTEGGKERLDSIRNATRFIVSEFGESQKEDVVVIFDAVRPFVSQQIMQDSLNALLTHDAVVASVPVVDTMLFVEEGTLVHSMPNRSKLFHGQAPDSFKLTILNQALNDLSEEEEKIITGTAQICMLKGIEVHTIPGDPENIKVTTPFDVQLAELLCKTRGEL